MKTQQSRVLALSILLLWAIPIFSLTGCKAQDLIPITPSDIGKGVIFEDSFSVDGYHLDCYRFPIDDFDPYGSQYLIFHGVNFLLSSPRCRFLDIHHRSFEGNPRTFKDINGDGAKDIVFVCGSGGSAGNENAYIITLDSSATVIASFEDYDKGPFGLIDFDSDGYPEPTMGDIHYECWHYGCSGSPRPYLVWKWDGEKYRLANYKLGDQILKLNSLILSYKTAGKTDSIELDTLNLNALVDFELRIGFYDPAVEQSYPVELLRIMLDLIYTGHSNWADTLFNKAWPDSVANKQLFYDDLMQQLRSDSYWPQLQQSDW